MDLSKLRAISNNYQNVRLLSLRDWKEAAEIENRDTGGPWAVIQEGYDPEDYLSRFNEFVLAKGGWWVPLGIFFELPKDVRRRDFIFASAAQVMELMHGLHGKPFVLNSVAEARQELGPDEQELNEVVIAAKKGKD